MTTSIRLAIAQDAPQIQAIYAPIVQDTYISFEQIIPSTEEIAARIEKTLKQYPWLVCEVDGQIAGYCYGSAFRTREAYQWTTEVTAYTHPDFHRRGIGRGLYTSLIEILQHQGYFNAVAGIALPNDASVRFHEALGFAVVGIYKNIGHKIGDWRDVGWWQLELQPMTDNPEPPIAIHQIKTYPSFSEWLNSGIPLIR